MSRRLIALLIVAVSVLAACGRASSIHPASGGYLIFLEAGFSSGAETVKVVDSGTGTVAGELPIGTPNADWSRYYVVTQLTGTAQLKAIDPVSGRTIAHTTIPAGYNLPNLGFQGPTAGLSPNGKWLALTSQTKASGGAITTNFLVGSSALTDSFKTIHVNGDFGFDALSNSGQGLYLIQKMSEPRHYEVRLYDLGAGWLLPQPVVDKREPNEPMNGIRGDSAADPTGNHVYTVYLRDSGPFIHALSLDQPFAFCVDLPKNAVNNIEQQFHWSLAITPDGSTVYAVNGSLGKVSLIRTAGTPTIVRTAPVALRHTGDLLTGLITNADAKGPQLGGSALSTDGQTLFTFGETGVLAIDTPTLKVRGHFLDPWRPDTMRLSSDGKWLYVAETGESKLWQIDPVTGSASEVKGVTHPWAVLWAQPK
jgi:DNA-binding beta-propeller fold protein YncE